MSGVMLLPAGGAGVVVLLGTLAFYLYERHEYKKNVEECAKQQKKKELEEARRARKLLTDPEFAKEEFFGIFCRFSIDERHENGRELLDSIKDKIVIPVIWEQDYEELPRDIDSKGSMGSVLKGYSPDRKLIAIHMKVSHSRGEAVTDEGVPYTIFHASNTHDIITLNDGREVKIEIPNVVYSGERMGEVSYSFGKYIFPTERNTTPHTPKNTPPLKGTTEAKPKRSVIYQSKLKNLHGLSGRKNLNNNLMDEDHKNVSGSVKQLEESYKEESQKKWLRGEWEYLQRKRAEGKQLDSYEKSLERKYEKLHKK
jgi:hypothetical protein